MREPTFVFPFQFHHKSEVAAAYEFSNSDGDHLYRIVLKPHLNEISQGSLFFTLVGGTVSAMDIEFPSRKGELASEIQEALVTELESQGILVSPPTH